MESRGTANLSPSQRAEYQNDEHRTIRRKCPTQIGIQISTKPDSVRKNVAANMTIAITITNLCAGFSAMATTRKPHADPLIAVMTNKPTKNHHGKVAVGALKIAGHCVRQTKYQTQLRPTLSNDLALVPAIKASMFRSTGHPYCSRGCRLRAMGTSKRIGLSPRNAAATRSASSSGSVMRWASTPKPWASAR